MPESAHGFRNRLLAGAARLLTFLLGRLPWRLSQRAGAGLGVLGMLVSGRDRRRAREHLAIAFPELPEVQRRRLVRACFRHLGSTLAECLHLMHADCATIDRQVEVEGWEHAERLRAEHRPLVVVTGHCGNWELLAALINCRGLEMRVIARQLDEPRFQRLLLGLRTRFGTETIARGGRSAARRLLATLRDGGCLGILIDQDTDVDGVWVPFFDRPAHTPVAPAQLAARHRAALLPAFIERRSDGSHLARFLAPLEPGDDPVADTAALTTLIENQVRRRPEQWVWMHRRWRKQPEGGG